jgi:hypothetical protein
MMKKKKSGREGSRPLVPLRVYFTTRLRLRVWLGAPVPVPVEVTVTT